ESRSIGWGFSVAGSTLAIIESYGTAGKVMAHDRPASPCLVPDSGAAVGQVFVPDQDGAGLRGVIDGLEPGLLDQLLHLRLVFRCKSPPLTGVAHLLQTQRVGVEPWQSMAPGVDDEWPGIRVDVLEGDPDAAHEPRWKRRQVDHILVDVLLAPM